MKKIINIINKIGRILDRIIFLVFDFTLDFLFCIRLFISLKHSYGHEYDEYRIKDIKLLLQFFGRSFDESTFEYYNLYKEESMYLLHLSLQKKNSLVFQVFVFFYCFIVDYFLFELVNIIFPYNNFRNKFVNIIFGQLFKIIKKQIENNFGYEYIREYKKYYRANKKFYKEIRFEIFYKETKLNLCYWWNEAIIKNNKKSKLHIDTDYLTEDIEQYF